MPSLQHACMLSLCRQDPVLTLREPRHHPTLLHLLVLVQQHAFTEGVLTRPRLRQVHASAVTALELSADGSVLYSGCDAAAPKRDPDAPDEEPVKLLSAQVRAQVQWRPSASHLFTRNYEIGCTGQDGRTLRSLHTESPANIRLIKTVRQHGSAVLCVDGQRYSAFHRMPLSDDSQLKRWRSQDGAVRAGSSACGARQIRHLQGPA